MIVHMEKLILLGDHMTMREMFRCVLMEVGATSAKMVGMSMIVLLFAHNLDILHQVSN